MNEQFHTSLGLVQNALTELLSMSEHRQHINKCNAPGCAVCPARDALDAYIECRKVQMEIPPLQLIRMHDRLTDLALTTQSSLARHRARSVIDATLISYRRAISFSAQAVSDKLQEWPGTKTGRFFGGRQNFTRHETRRPMAVPFEDKEGGDG